MTSPPSASAANASSTAAALLFTTRVAVWGTPWRANNCANRRCACSSRLPRSPFSRSNSRLLYPDAASVMRSTASRESGARPRLVWIITPLALITRRREYAVARSTRRSRACGSAISASSKLSQSRAPLEIFERNSSSSARAASVTFSRPCSETSAATSAILSNSSTAGNRRNISDLGTVVTALHRNPRRITPWRSSPAKAISRTGMAEACVSQTHQRQDEPASRRF